MLGPEDGQGDVVNAARSLCEAVSQQRTAISEVDSSLINNKLIGIHVCGTQVSNLGLLYMYIDISVQIRGTKHRLIYS